jgi:hypothetical protein
MPVGKMNPPPSELLIKRKFERKRKSGGDICRLETAYCFPKHGVPLQLADEKSGVDCVRNVEKISNVPS